jgi:hypothetical protein
MMVMMRDDFESRAHSLSPAIGSGVHNMSTSTQYRVLFMWCRPESTVFFLDWGGPFPDGVDSRLCTIVEHSVESGWKVGLHLFGDGEELMLMGPDFWTADYHWYERLLDGDSFARHEYQDYLKHLARR